MFTEVCGCANRWGAALRTAFYRENPGNKPAVFGLVNNVGITWNTFPSWTLEVWPTTPVHRDGTTAEDEGGWSVR